MDGWTTTLIIGAGVLIGAVGTYLRKPDQWIFPVVLALVGVVLCGANAVKFAFGDGTSIEINRTLVDSADANFKQIAAQQETIDKLALGLGKVEITLSALTEAVGKQAAAQQIAANQTPATTDAPASSASGTAASAAAVTAADASKEQLKSLRAATGDLAPLLNRSRDASNQALIANRRLESAARVAGIKP